VVPEFARQRHQVGFDWQDFEWTAAGAAFGDTLTDIEPGGGQRLMQKLADGTLSLANLYQPVMGASPGYLEFDPFVSPGWDTSSDKIDAAIETMRAKLLS
jgi:hypothetical protein